MGTHPATTYGPETPMVAEDVANGLPYGVTGNAPHWCGGCGFESRWGSDSKRGDYHWNITVSFVQFWLNALRFLPWGLFKFKPLKFNILFFI